jgi:hypothetical protein
VKRESASEEREGAPVSKDVKRMVQEIRQALDAYPRDQLQEILAFVFKEYVVEGGAATGALAMLDARSELEGLSFAELVTWLQLHLDVPELALFEVAGGRVHVRAGGRALPLEVARAPEPLPTVAPATSTASPSTSGPSATTSAPPATSAAPTTSAPSTSAPSTNAPPATSAPSTNAPPAPGAPAAPRPAPGAGATPPSPAANAPASPAAPAPSPSGDKKDESGAPASRFSWLEVD